MKVTSPAGRKVLYFGPGPLAGNVIREVRQWAPHRSVVDLSGKTKVQRRFLLDTMKEHPEYVVFINYEAWRRDKSLVQDLIDLEFDTCIIDEAHIVKDRKAQAYRGVRQVLYGSMDIPKDTSLTYRVPFVIPMTGTPILNKPQEFFSLLTLVDPYHFYDERWFLADYCLQDYDTGKWRFKPGGIESLFKRFPNLLLRRTKEQAGINLPPKTITVHEIEVDEDAYPAQAKARTQMRDWGSIMLDPDKGTAISAAAAIAVYTRLRQIEVWPAAIKIRNPRTKEIILELGDEYAESQKIDYAIKAEEDGDWTGILPEVLYDRASGEGERAVVFSQFKQPLHEIKARLESAGYRTVIMDGDTSDAVRNEVAKDFDNRYTPDPKTAKWDVVLCNYKVGGVGLTFTAATQMVVLDEEWNPGKRDQAYDRIHRIGQDKPVTIHVLRTRPKAVTGQPVKMGIDVWLANLIAEKEAMVDGFNGAADDLAGQGFAAIKSGLI